MLIHNDKYFYTDFFGSRRIELKYKKEQICNSFFSYYFHLQ